MAPNILSDLIPPLVDETNNDGLRSSDHIVIEDKHNFLYVHLFEPGT